MDRPRIGAIVFDREEDPDGAVVAFLAARPELRTGGLIQEHVRTDESWRDDVHVRDLVTGERLNVMQDLGRDASGCRVDPAAIALAAGWLRRARERRPDLLIVNRFGRLESEGGGALAEIGEAVAEDIPLLLCVSRKYLGAWNAFASGLDAQLQPRVDAIESWWGSLDAALEV